MLFTFSIFTIIFGAVLFMLSNPIRRPPRNDQSPAYFSVYRDILDLALEVKKELGDGSEDLSARKLDKCIKTATGAVRIEEDVLLTSRFEKDNKTPSTSSHKAPISAPTTLRRLYPSRMARFMLKSKNSRIEEAALMNGGGFEADKPMAISTTYEGEGDQLMSRGLR